MTLPGDVLPESLWDSVRHNHRRLLMLDYDGTLVPFRERRDEAYLDQDSLDLLRAIAITTQLAIISGRPAADLERFLPLPILRVAEHGWEEITVAGGHIVHPLPERAGVALQAAYETAAANDFVQFLERKRCSLVLHTRGLPAAQARSLEALCERVWGHGSPDDPVRLTRISGGRELRALGRDKGTAATGLMAASPDGVAVYIGDDTTDEDAFHAVDLLGFGIRVGRAREVKTKAKHVLRSPVEVFEFLRRWCVTARGDVRDRSKGDADDSRGG